MPFPEKNISERNARIDELKSQGYVLVLIALEELGIGIQELYNHWLLVRDLAGRSDYVYNFELTELGERWFELDTELQILYMPAEDVPDLARYLRKDPTEWIPVLLEIKAKLWVRIEQIRASVPGISDETLIDLLHEEYNLNKKSLMLLLRTGTTI